jgi:nucleotide-binding universal stress UspA family protein
MTTIHRILYATDLSSTSEPAWDEARRLGRLFNAEILLLHVVSPPLDFPVEGYFPPDVYEDLLHNARRDAEKGFDRLLGSVAGSGLKVRIRLEERAPAASRILEARPTRRPISWSSGPTAARGSRGPCSGASPTGWSAKRRARS